MPLTRDSYQGHPPSGWPLWLAPHAGGSGKGDGDLHGRRQPLAAGVQHGERECGILVGDRLAARTVALPFFANLSERQVARVQDVLTAAIAQSG